MLGRAKSKDTETVINALIKQAKKLPRELYRLTWDRGKELADHKRWTRKSKSGLRLERKHQWASATILSEGDGSLKCSPEQTKRRSETT